MKKFLTPQKKEPVLTFERILPRNPENPHLFMVVHELDDSIAGTNLRAKDFFNVPVLCHDGRVRMSSRHKVLTGGYGGHLCVLDAKTEYGRTSPCVCILRFSNKLKTKLRGEHEMTHHGEAYKTCIKCPLTLNWFTSENEIPEAATVVEEEED